MWLQAATQVVTGHHTYGYRPPHLRLQGTTPTVAGAALSLPEDRIVLGARGRARQRHAPRGAGSPTCLLYITLLNFTTLLLYFTLLLYYFTSQRHAARGAGNRAVLATKSAEPSQA